MSTTEAFAIGSLLVSETARRDVTARGFTSEGLSDPILAEIADAIIVLTERGQPVDVVTVGRQLADMDAVATAADVERIAEQVVTYGTPELAPYYLDRVEDDARQRQRIEGYAAIVERVRADPGYDPAADLETLQRRIVLRSDATRHVSVLIDQVLADARARYSSGVSANVLSTGLPSLDHRLHGGGLHPGELVILAGRPGSGKTAFAGQIAMNVARAGGKVLFVSAEMSGVSLARRMAIEHTGIPAVLFDGVGEPARHLVAKRAEAIERIEAEVRELPIMVHDAARPTIADMKTAIRRHGPFALVLFDYTSLAGDVVRSDSEERRMAAIALGLQELARDCGVPVIALHQLNRSVETTKPYLPTLAHLRDSGQVEANAHLVFLLYRRQYYVEQGMLDEDEASAHDLNVIVAKNREGTTGSVTLHWEGESFRIRERRVIG